MEVYIPNGPSLDYIKSNGLDISQLLDLGVWASKLIKDNTKNKCIIYGKDDFQKRYQEEEIKDGNTDIKDIKYQLLQLTSLLGSGTIKGKIAERVIGTNLCKLLPNAEIDDTGYIAGAGDIVVQYKGCRVMIEIKNYSKNVPRSEQEKFSRDLLQNKYNSGILVSCTSGIANKHNKFEYSTVQGKLAIYLSNAGSDGNSVMWAILFIVAITNMLKNIDQNNEIQRKLVILHVKSELDVIKSCIIDNNNVVNQLTSMRNNIVRCMNNEIIALEKILDANNGKLKKLIRGFDKLVDNGVMNVNLDVVDVDSSQNINLENMKVSELRTMAEKMNIPDVKKLKKPELINSIRKYKSRIIKGPGTE